MKSSTSAAQNNAWSRVETRCTFSANDSLVQALDKTFFEDTKKIKKAQP